MIPIRKTQNHISATRLFFIAKISQKCLRFSAKCTVLKSMCHVSSCRKFGQNIHKIRARAHEYHHGGLVIFELVHNTLSIALTLSGTMSAIMCVILEIVK